MAAAGAGLGLLGVKNVSTSSEPNRPPALDGVAMCMWEGGVCVCVNESSVHDIVQRKSKPRISPVLYYMVDCMCLLHAGVDTYTHLCQYIHK